MKRIFLTIWASLLSMQAIAIDITTTKGETFTNATVVRKEPDGITISYSKGVAKIRFENLPADIQSKFGYDPQAAGSYRAAQAAKKPLASLVPKRTANDIQGVQFSGEIAQIIPGGALVQRVHFHSSYQGPSVVSAADMWNVIASSASTPPTKEYGEMVYIMGVPGDLVDGNAWSGQIFECGRYQYTSVNGSISTVKKYATTKEAAQQEILYGH